MFLQTLATDSLGPIGVRLINAYQPKYDGLGLRKMVCLSFTILDSIWKLTCLSRLTRLTLSPGFNYEILGLQKKSVQSPDIFKMGELQELPSGEHTKSNGKWPSRNSGFSH